MHFVVVTQYRSTVDILRGIIGGGNGDSLCFVVEEARLERYVQRTGLKVVRSRFRDRTAYEKLELGPQSLMVVHLRESRRLKGLLKVLDTVRNEAPVLVLHTDSLEDLKIQQEHFPFVQFLPLSQHFAPVFSTATRLARNRKRLQHLQEAAQGAKNLLILMQDDPDPDAVSSALALRHLLDRNRSTCPIASFGRVTRPENLAMLRLLDIQIMEEFPPAQLQEYERIAMVDAQPSRFKAELPRVDIVIDHHPEQPGCNGAFKDVRTSYGATATILTEYLRTKGTKISERLATSLIYGIRTDTLLLDRGVADADVEAFAYLYPLSNINTVRRIERPELPVIVLDSFAEGLRNRRIAHRVIFSHLGEVIREDVIPQLADFCLQVEGVEWSVVSGTHGGNFIVSVRNVGFVRAAGDVIRDAFGDLGSAGGHRSMAKAVVPLASLGLDPEGGLDPAKLSHLQGRFLRALRSGGKSAVKAAK
jgi:nanoRNase/pAp phosphatase (c-di-AMP/oligoRNAs hydrolase)